MKINNQEIDISDLISQKYMHKNIGNGIFLSDYQIEILIKYGIDPYKCSGTDDLIFQIEEVLEDDDSAEDLDNISREISEFNYYTNTNK
jgi:hypothetical protein